MIINAKKEYVFTENKKAPSCHASTVLPLDNGCVLLAWFAGKREGHNSVGIWTSIRDENGNWSAPENVTAKENIPLWNPVLHQREDGNIVLYFKRGKKIPDWQTYYMISSDMGKTWSEAKELVENDTTGGRGPVKNKCIRLKDGTLLAPASTEQNNKWIPFVDISKDDGITWRKTKLMERPKYKGAYVALIQPTLWQDTNNDVHCFLRSNKCAVYRSDSSDNGQNWCKPYRTRLPNNNSGIDCAVDSQNRLWLIYNPVDVNWGVRYPLSLAYSKDNGKHFEEVLKPECISGEFSYPAIVSKGNRLYISYTYKRRKIVYWEIETE